MDITTIVGVVLGFVMVLVAILIGGDVASYLNAPSVLIVVGVALETMKQIDSQLMMRNYEGFLK